MDIAPFRTRVVLAVSAGCGISALVLNFPYPYGGRKRPGAPHSLRVASGEIHSDGNAESPLLHG
jgi:hypothetical protein